MDLMAEDPERQRRRQYLLKEKGKVSTAQQWLSTAKGPDASASEDHPMPSIEEEQFD